MWRRGKVLTKRVANETSPTGPIVKGCPRRGKKDSSAVTFPERGKLALDLVWVQKIIGIQPLDVVALTQLERLVSSRGLASILRGKQTDPF
jgi:hypothetical protein